MADPQDRPDEGPEAVPPVPPKKAAPKKGTKRRRGVTVEPTDLGPSDASGVAVTDVLPSGLAFVSAAPSQGAYTAATGVWTVGSVANGASATLAIVATVTQAGTIVNTATTRSLSGPTTIPRAARTACPTGWPRSPPAGISSHCGPVRAMSSSSATRAWPVTC